MFQTDQMKERRNDFVISTAKDWTDIKMKNEKKLEQVFVRSGIPVFCIFAGSLKLAIVGD